MSDHPADHAADPADLAAADTPPAGVLMVEPGADDEPTQVDTEPSPARRMSRGMRSLLEWALVIVIALIVALGVRKWVFQPFWIPSGSMNDTLSEGDRVLVNKLSYRLHDINRGGVVVFSKPETWALQDDVKDLIKRVIGLPGETVTIEACGVYIDRDGEGPEPSQKLVEPYTDGQCTQPAESVLDPDGDGSFVVEEGMIFVMGDNRNGSEDSRYHGLVPEDDVVGRAFVVIWPKGHWRWL